MNKSGLGLALILTTITTASAPAWAQAGQALNLDVLSMLLSLLAVIAVILLLAFFVKRLNPNLAMSDEFKVIRTLPLGTKERLLVIEIDNKQHLIGVTPHAINYLYELNEPLEQKPLPPLAQQLSQLINPTKKAK